MIVLLLSLLPHLFSNPSQPIELGNVQWLRSYDEAIQKSKSQGKPILILFQEVPGCQTCRMYGSEVLTHPLIVEAIETHFVPLAVFNNKGGADAEVLKLFREPAWNNPVVRIVNQEGKDILPRLSGNYSAYGLTSMMVHSLIQSSGKAPTYLQLLADELGAKVRGTKTVTYSMYCFWTGESLFGGVNGVVATTAGFQNGSEVVKVEYDPTIITKSQLDKLSAKIKCKIPGDGSFRPDTTPKYYLSNSAYKNITMTEIQKCRVNAALAERQNPKEFLSPRQIQGMK